MKAKFTEKASYFAGAMAYGLEVNAVMAYMLVYCTDVLYLSPIIIGTLMLGAKVLDAITDILITNIADRTETSMGKYRPWLFCGIPLAILFALFFWTPDFLTTDVWKMAWVCVVYILMVPVCETAYMCPLVVMGTIMSSDSNDRLDFATARTVGENAGEFLVSSLCMTIVLAFGSYHDIAGWRMMGICFAVIIVLGTLAGVLGTKERIVIDNKDEEGNILTLKQKFSLLRGKKPYYLILLAQLGLLVAWIANISLFPYFCTHVLGKPEWVSILSAIGVTAQLTGTVLVSRLGRKYEKRSLIFVGACLMACSASALLMADSLVSTVLFQILRGLSIGLVYVCTWSALPEVNDYIHWKSGIAIPGLVLGIVSFCTKIFSAIGSYAATVVLELGGYDSVSGIPSAVTAGWIRGGMAATLVFGTVVIFSANMGLTDLSRVKVERYHREIEDRKNHVMA